MLDTSTFHTRKLEVESCAVKVHTTLVRGCSMRRPQIEEPPMTTLFSVQCCPLEQQAVHTSHSSFLPALQHSSIYSAECSCTLHSKHTETSTQIRGTHAAWLRRPLRMQSPDQAPLPTAEPTVIHRTHEEPVRLLVGCEQGLTPQYHSAQRPGWCGVGACAKQLILCW